MNEAILSIYMNILLNISLKLAFFQVHAGNMHSACDHVYQYTEHSAYKEHFMNVY